MKTHKLGVLWFLAIAVTFFASASWSAWTTLGAVGTASPVSARGTSWSGQAPIRGALPELPDPGPGSADQRLWVRTLGPPQQFLVACAEGQRAEVWLWTRASGGDYLVKEGFCPLRVSFLDGELRQVQELPELTARVPATNWKPWQFPTQLTPQQLSQSWGGPDAVFQQSTRLFGNLEARKYRDELVVVFSNGRLMGAQTMAGRGMSEP